MVNIRILSKDYREEVESLIYRSVDNDIGREKYNAYYPQNVIDINRCLNGINGQCLVAINDKGLVGYVQVLTKSKKGHPTPSAEIYDLYVKPIHRKEGIGTLLMARAFDYAKNTKAKHVLVEVAKKNNNAINLYRKFGMTTQVITDSSYILGADL